MSAELAKLIEILRGDMPLDSLTLSIAFLMAFIIYFHIHDKRE